MRDIRAHLRANAEGNGKGCLGVCESWKLLLQAGPGAAQVKAWEPPPSMGSARIHLRVSCRCNRNATRRLVVRKSRTHVRLVSAVSIVPLPPLLSKPSQDAVCPYKQNETYRGLCTISPKNTPQNPLNPQPHSSNPTQSCS